MSSDRRSDNFRGKKLHVGWKVASLDAKIASIRYRALVPMFALNGGDFEHKLFADYIDKNLNNLDVIVFVKSFTEKDYMLAQMARRRGIRIILDLCDNIFIDGYGSTEKNKRASVFGSVFKSMALFSNAIVVTTQPLADVVSAIVGDSITLRIIPDGIITKEIADWTDFRIGAIKKTTKNIVKKESIRLPDALYLLRVDGYRKLLKHIVKRLVREIHARPWLLALHSNYSKLRNLILEAFFPVRHKPVYVANDEAKKILWFGNQGAPYADFGILDLLIIRDDLEAIASKFNVELVVVSNNYEKYINNIKPFAIRSRYVEWSANALREQMGLASAVVIPSSPNVFSYCKSANRAVLALTYGVPVVATATPALEVLSECTIQNNFINGLEVYLSDAVRVKKDIELSKEAIEKSFGLHVVSNLWKDVFFRTLDEDKKEFSSPDVIFILYLIQDLDLALPIIIELNKRNIVVQVFCSDVLVKKYSRILTVLGEMSIEVILQKEVRDEERIFFPKSAKIMLSVVESNLNPHRFSRKIIKQANKSGLLTVTLQHGFENIGLSYHDNIHDLKKIDFLSQIIYIWGDFDTLNSKVSAATRAKCVPVGCFKPISVAKAELDTILPRDKPIIGIFENLHWHRYTDEYRQFFIRGIFDLAEKYPNVNFLIKPHHAGMWLTSRYSGDAPRLSNVIIADPLQSAWEAWTAPSLFGYLSAVITTPSTVALDSARQGIPTAVVAQRMDLNNYLPLSLIKSTEDWFSFLDGVINKKTNEFIINTQEFVNRVLLPGNAVERMVDDMLKRAPVDIMEKYE